MVYAIQAVASGNGKATSHKSSERYYNSASHSYMPVGNSGSTSAHHSNSTTSSHYNGSSHASSGYNYGASGHSSADKYGSKTKTASSNQSVYKSDKNKNTKAAAPATTIASRPRSNPNLLKPASPTFMPSGQ